jgi:segregation and condensation protein B
LNEPGRPKTYGTTAEFLDYFGLQDLTELPALPEDTENSAEDQDNEDLFLQEFESKMTTNKE